MLSQSSNGYILYIGSHRETLNIVIAILKKKTIVILYTRGHQNFSRILGALLLFSLI